jgi:hypothetical protein
VAVGRAAEHGKECPHHSRFSLPFFIVSPDILVVRIPMARRAPGELEQLLNRLPHAVLFRFQDEARKAFTRYLSLTKRSF